MIVIDLLVEGLLDEAVARRLVTEQKLQVGTVFGKKGYAYIQQKIAGFNVRAKFGSPMLVLIDFMDTNLPCPGLVVSTLTPDKSENLIFRIVVRELESWLLADRSGVADFFGISENHVPTDCENLGDPKLELVNLARRSRRTRIRNAIVPKAGSSGIVGPGYVAEMTTFVLERWDVSSARINVESLDRCLQRLESLRSSMQHRPSD